MQDINANLDTDIAEVIVINYGNVATVYTVWNNVTQQWANNGKQYNGPYEARNEARRIIAQYNGSNNLIGA